MESKALNILIQKAKESEQSAIFYKEYNQQINDKINTFTRLQNHLKTINEFLKDFDKISSLTIHIKSNIDNFSLKNEKNLYPFDAKIMYQILLKAKEGIEDALQKIEKETLTLYKDA